MDEKIRAIFDSELFQKAAAFLQEDAQHTIEQQLQLVEIPSFSNHEELRAKAFQQLMEAEGYASHRDEVNNV